MTEHANIQRLQTLEEHRDMLRHVFSTAQERILIVSPFISMSAIESDNISGLVGQAAARGVDVQIFVDSESNCYSDGTMKTRALDGIAELVAAGCRVGVANGIKSKILARDNDLFTVGRFNWLSAPGIRSGQCQLIVGSEVYSGTAAAEMVIRELNIIEITGYELALAEECGFIEVTRAGKIFGLCSVIAIFILAEMNPIHKLIGCASVLLMTLTYHFKRELREPAYFHDSVERNTCQ